MLVALHVVTGAAVLLKVTVLLPCVAPKFVPVMVIEVPTAPEALLSPATIAGTTKLTTLLATPDAVTTTLPVVAPTGTVTTMLVALQLVTEVAAVPLKVIVLVPWAAPKFVPVIVIEVPTAPEVWLRPVMVGFVDAAVLELLAHPASPMAKVATRTRIHSSHRTPRSELCLVRRLELDRVRPERVLGRGARQSMG